MDFDFGDELDVKESYTFCLAFDFLRLFLSTILMAEIFLLSTLVTS